MAAGCESASGGLQAEASCLLLKETPAVGRVELAAGLRNCLQWCASWVRKCPRELPEWHKEFTRPRQVQFWLCGGGLNTGIMPPAYRLPKKRVLHSCPSNPHPGATRLRLSLDISGTFQAIIPLQELRVPANESVCQPFKKTPVFPAAFLLTQMV